MQASRFKMLEECRSISPDAEGQVAPAELEELLRTQDAVDDVRKFSSPYYTY